LGSRGLNIMKFCKEFNDRTRNIDYLNKGTLVTVIIHIYGDKSFSFFIKSPPTSILIKNKIKIESKSKI